MPYSLAHRCLEPAGSATSGLQKIPELQARTEVLKRYSTGSTLNIFNAKLQKPEITERSPVKTLLIHMRKLAVSSWCQANATAVAEEMPELA